MAEGKGLLVLACGRACGRGRHQMAKAETIDVSDVNNQTGWILLFCSLL